VIEKGVIRYLYLVLDVSWCMEQTDLKPSRKLLVLELVEEWILEFFDQNPLSQLGLIVAANKLAVHVTELSGNPRAQIDALRHAAEQEGGGEFSLQNALELARSKLASIPPYGAREILVVLGALSSVDPGDVTDTITALKEAHVTASVIALAAELYVCTLLATTTGGQLGAAGNNHYRRHHAFFVDSRMHHVVAICRHM
jgi:transcription initiation factor TFIIH subunit 2